MRVAITGATGFIGTALVDHLLARGDEVVALSRDPERARRPGVTCVKAELETAGAWWDALAGAHAIVHLAGEPLAGRRWDARQKQIIRDSRVESARNIVEAIAKLDVRPQVLVTASGVDYYPFAAGPDGFDDDEVTEADPPADTFLGRLCRDWEREARAAQAFGVRTVAMRTGLVLGPGGALAKMKKPFELHAGGRMGNGRQWVSWIHRDDAVAAYAAALADARYTGAINLVTDSTRNAELSHALAGALGRRSWLPVPAFALRAAVGELAESILEGRRVVPARLRALGFSWRYPTLAAALAAIQPRTSSANAARA